MLSSASELYVRVSTPTNVGLPLDMVPKATLSLRENVCTEEPVTQAVGASWGGPDQSYAPQYQTTTKAFLPPLQASFQNLATHSAAWQICFYIDRPSGHFCRYRAVSHRTCSHRRRQTTFSNVAAS